MLSYLKENWMISLRTLAEFKSNTYIILFFGLVDTIIFLLFGYLFVGIVGDIISWSFIDFILFFYIGIVVLDVGGTFYFSGNANLKHRITTGYFNILFCKPGNRFFLHLFKIEFNPILFYIVDTVVLLPIILIYGDWTFISLFLTTLGIIILIVFTLLFALTLESFTFRFLEFGQYLRYHIHFQTLMPSFRQFPSQVFGKADPLRYIFCIYPLFFISMILVPLFQNRFIEFPLIELSVLFGSGFIFLLLLIWNWKYGIRKYEAYG